MTPEEQAAMDAAQEKAIRELATQITQMTKLGFDPLTVRKGIIAGINDATSPPTISINISGDTTTLVSQVRTMNNYTPLVNQTVLVAKQGAEIFLLGSIASVNPAGNAAASEDTNGWTKAELSNGTHGGASGEADVHYRRIMDHGSWKMQWRGWWNTSAATTMIAAGGLETDYRPSTTRYLAAAREATGAVTIRLAFLANGSVVAASSAPTLSIASVNVGTDSANTASTVSHSHGGAVATSTITHDDGFHSHTTNSHSHSGSTATVSYPSWICLDGIEYFL